MPIINTVIAGGGTTPTGTKSITANGVYDVTNYASADVQVPTTAPAHYIEKTVDANGMLQNNSTMINLNGVTDVGDYVFRAQYAGVVFPVNTNLDLSSLTSITGANCFGDAFRSCQNIISVDLSSVTQISGMLCCGYMFQSCPGLISADLSSLTQIGGNSSCNYMFSGCPLLSTVDLSSLAIIGGNSVCSYMFMNCYALTNMNLSSVNKISGLSPCGSMFQGCTGLISVNLNGLNITSQLAPSYGPMFTGCTHLESVTLGGLTASTFASDVNQIAYLFNASTGSQAPNGCTVHFPSNFDPSDPNHTFDASTLTGYPTFGGSASYIHVAFDLPASE